MQWKSARDLYYCAKMTVQCKTLKTAGGKGHVFTNWLSPSVGLSAGICWDTGYPHDGRADKDSYPHDGRANKNSYPHDGRADKDSYPHDRHNQYTMLSL